MLLAILALTLCLQFLNVSASSCGYDACPVGKDDMLNVHIICHTHDDVGWLQTVDAYYDLWVKDIISSVVSHLIQNENRKFSYVEMAYFTKWWSQQTHLVKEYVRRLVDDGRLEFVSGGWSMNDEATTHYLGIIDQMTLGLRWLNSTFGKCGTPQVGWQIDSFGHSREQASLFAQMAFDGQFLGRLHYQDKFWRIKTKTMETMWEASQSLGSKARLFTSVLPNVYWPPKGFCFDVFCADEELTEDNIHIKSHQFLSLAEEQSKQYATNHIVFTMGMDFYYRDASKWYRNLDYLIQYVNSLQAIGLKVNAFYSTPSCYLNSLSKTNVSWPTMTTDFFPYASKQHEYWTGYFTSRPALKYLARKCNAYFQACKQLVALSNSETNKTVALSEALGVIQHHDGITGTEKQHVATDYVRQLSSGYQLCSNAIEESLLKLMFSNNEDRHITNQKLFFCAQTNLTECYFTEHHNEFLVIVYNALGQQLSTYVRLPVIGVGYNVTKISQPESPLSSQVVLIPLPILYLPERSSTATRELIFPIDVLPLGISIYKVNMMQEFESVFDNEHGMSSTLVQDSVIENEFFQIMIDGNTGLMKEIVILPATTRVPLKQSFYFYEGMPGYRIERASGAYAFNPQYDIAFPLGENVTYRIFKGHLVQEVHQYFTPWISQVIRLYRSQPYVEFDWVVGPIPVHDHIGREVISRFDSDLYSGGVFYTDSNGRETMKRVRDFQQTFPWNITEHIAGNYYPITSAIYIQDESQNLQLSILNDRAQGGSSVTDGSIELMVHRRLLFDDGYGVNEALNEPGSDGRGVIARGSHFLTLGPIENMLKSNKALAKKIFYPPVLAYAHKNLSYDLLATEFQGLATALPSNVHILTLEKLEPGVVLIRLENFLEKSDDPEFDGSVTLSLIDMFAPFDVIQYKETTLAANQYLDEVVRLRWNSENDTDVLTDADEYWNSHENGNVSSMRNGNQNELLISLTPMEIRTFIVHVGYKNSL